jgi:hypothetical protein
MDGFFMPAIDVYACIKDAEKQRIDGTCGRPLPLCTPSSPQPPKINPKTVP